MKLPAQYAWLNNIGTLPKLVTAGLDYYDMREIAGVKNNQAIMNMARDLGVADIYTSDEISWCALFICYLCHLTGKPQPFKDYEILRAASFAKWGNAVPKGQEMLGDVLVFKRPGGNHVGIYIGETTTSFLVYGGNQSNKVGFTEIAKNRMIASRRYYATAAPASAKKYHVVSGGKLSVNEA